MANVKIKLDEQGIRKMLKSKGMQRICEAHANRALSKLGKGYIATTRVEETRVFTSVYAESREAKKDNLENNTILKALRG